ncbi:MAG TPA: hypothetical protein VFE42_17335 [Chloroflexota bacterium]|nr:hypothetical protein [Chloroflexota bacterium]
MVTGGSIKGNAAGGGIDNGGTLTVVASTISGDAAARDALSVNRSLLLPLLYT